MTILVGAEKKSYHVHKDIICCYSEYFRAAYNGRWKEAKEGVTLEDVEVEVFNLFVHWLYTQEFPRKFDELIRIAEADVAHYDGYEGSCASMLQLKACVFGNRFLVPGFQKDAHNCFVFQHRNSKGVEYDDIIYAFNNFLEDDLMLAFMVTKQYQDWSILYDHEEDKERWEKLPQKFLLRVMLMHGEREIEPTYEAIEFDIANYTR